MLYYLHCSLYIYYGASLEMLLNIDIFIFVFTVHFMVLVTYKFDQFAIMQRKIICWPLLGLKGLLLKFVKKQYFFDI